MDLNKVQSEMDFGDESYKRTLQKKITKKLLEKPVIESVDDLLDWKMELWEYQYGIDYRMQSLCDSFLSTDEIENFIDTIICNPYIPELPFFNQTLMLLTHGDILYGGARGGGKALELDTLIPTPNGFTTMEDLMVGDEVFDEQGNICKVTSKSDVFFDHQCYKLVFDDGSTVIADENHRWLTDDRASRQSKSRAKHRVYKNNQFSRSQKHKMTQPEVRTTKTIYETLTKGSRGDTNHSIDVCEPLDLPERDLPIEPYCLGLWLGDGTSSNGSFTTADPELLDAFTGAGYEVTERSVKYHYGVIGLHKDLRENGLLNNKHIPSDYLRASKEQRLSLIQGLMDTDGNILKTHQCEFVQKNEKVIDGLIELLRTFGIKVTKRTTYKTDSKDKPKQKYFCIKFTTNLPVFRLKRKSERLPDELRPIQKRRMIKECIPIDSVPCQCITVDSPNHMFLCTENFIPTHNSSAVLMGALQYVEFSEWKVGIFRLTYKDLTSAGAILNRAESWLYENPILKKAGIEPAYSKTKYTFTFPSGAEIQFAQIQYDDDAKHYQGAEFNEIYLDEAPQFSKVKLNRIKASVRKSIESPLPTGMKFTGNPGEVSTEYFRDKFVQGDGYFIDSKFIDNYYLDFEEYEERVFEDLKYEDPVLYAQWRNGDWNASNSGSMFRTDWFKFYTTINERITRRVRFWDLASTEKVDPTKGDDPDWTVGTLLFRGESGRLYLDNIVRFRGEPDEVEETIHEVAMQDGKDVSIFVEQEGGASGKAYVNYLQRVLQGYNFEGISARKDKVSRAKPVASSVKYGNLRLRDGEDWIPDFIAELTSFPTSGVHDDQVDSLSGAFAQITDLGDTPNSPTGAVNHSRFNYLNSLV